MSGIVTPNEERFVVIPEPAENESPDEAPIANPVVRRTYDFLKWFRNRVNPAVACLPSSLMTDIVLRKVLRLYLFTQRGLL
jgi:hypothetical protein